MFSVGYEGRTVTEFLRHIREQGIQRVIDVRERPQSRKKGFSGRGLQQSLEEAGVEYVHLGELGTPKEVRKAYKGGGSFSTFERRYRSHLDTQDDALKILVALSLEKPSALLCFERDWRVCHRSVLCEYLEGEGFNSQHL